MCGCVLNGLCRFSCFDNFVQPNTIFSNTQIFFKLVLLVVLQTSFLVYNHVLEFVCMLSFCFLKIYAKLVIILIWRILEIRFFCFNILLGMTVDARYCRTYPRCKINFCRQMQYLKLNLPYYLIQMSTVVFSFRPVFLKMYFGNTSHARKYCGNNLTFNILHDWFSYNAVISFMI